MICEFVQGKLLGYTQPLSRPRKLCQVFVRVAVPFQVVLLNKPILC